VKCLSVKKAGAASKRKKRDDVSTITMPQEIAQNRR
jgi:hypothetical protein